MLPVLVKSRTSTGLVMLQRFAPLMLALLMPLSAAAQQFVPVGLADTHTPMIDRLISLGPSADAAGSNSQVVPLWASPDGRLLAIVALSHGNGAPALPPSPAFGGVSDLRIIDATDLFSSGLRWRLGNGLRADMLVGRQAAPISFESHSANDCVSLNCAQGNNSLQGLLSGTLGFGWTSPASAFDVSFGLSWLDRRVSDTAIPSSSSLGAFDLTFVDVGTTTPFALDSARSLTARATWQPENGPLLDLTAGLSQGQLTPVWYGLHGSGLDLNQASLGLGLSSGSLRGSIVGHVISIDDPSLVGSKRWSGLDLGVSWRTPWRGEVSVGAQNFWSAPLDSSAARDADSAQSRVPYVQYRQDL